MLHLVNGKLAKGYGPVFADGTAGGAYTADLGKAIEIAEVKTWSFNQNKNRDVQRFVLFGSTATHDPGWDANKYTPTIEVGTTVTPADKFLGARGADGSALGTHRWLMWVAAPVTERGKSTAFQEFQILVKP